MNNNLIACHRWVSLLISVCALSLTLSGCGGGDDGAQGPAGPPGPGVASKSAATTLSISITGVSINSAPVVNFTVTNQDNSFVTGITTSDLRFTIAKLIPGANGAVPAWQNYINVASRQGLPYIRGNRENNGTLVDHQNGTYTYTFNTDITDPAETCPAAPAACLDPDDNTLDTSYNASLIHRVAIQTSGLPVTAGVYTFIPGSGAVMSGREIVASAACNECHNQLEAHDARTDTQYCVMCHNPGSTARGTVGAVVNTPTPLDFKDMIHKIHYGPELASVLDPDGDTIEVADAGEYAITGFSGTHSFKDVHFPQDINNCDKCHTGAVTAQGDNWKDQPSKAACGSCHDNVYFGTLPNATKAYETVSHITVSTNAGAPAPADPTDDTCITCHGAGEIADVAVAHAVPVNVAVTKFQFNIISICGTAVGSSPNCAAMSQPIVRFSVSDPTGATTHGHGNLYDVAGATNADRDPEFGASASLNIVSGWISGNSITTGTTVAGIDYTNDDGAGDRPARANSVSALTNATEDPMNPGTYLITLPAALPAVARSGVIAIEGHPRGETVVGSGTFNINVPVAGAVAYFGIGGQPAIARRVAVDIETKCDNCHRTLSLHGANRADNAQLCVICHNPRNTDVKNRPKDADGLPVIDLALAPDGKFEESIDFKRLIHGIHAAQRDDPNTPGVIEGHGFRENGLGIQGRNPGLNNFDDFSHIRFPGILNDCTTCHNTGTYELTGLWQAPLQNGILAVTMRAAPDPIGTNTYTTQVGSQTDDLLTTPTAAVCSACHDGAQAQAHMETIGGAKFSVKQAAIDTSYETCSICHGPGRTADVKVVHGAE